MTAKLQKQSAAATSAANTASPSNGAGGSITDRAMLVNLHIHCWTGVRVDKRATKSVTDANYSDRRAGQFNKSLFVKGGLLDQLRQIETKARQLHESRTLPWEDKGWRVLLSAGYWEYSRLISDLKAEYDSKLSQFERDYYTEVQQARNFLGGLFDSSEYPPFADLMSAGKFRFDHEIKAIDGGGKDFRVNLGDQETARIQADIEERLTKQTEVAMADVYGRLQGAVERMRERLQAFTDARQAEIAGTIPRATGPGTRAGDFRDTIVSNIQDLVELIPSLNLTNDAKLAQLAADAKTYLTSYSADELRDQDTARQRTIDKADEILKSMGDFI